MRSGVGDSVVDGDKAQTEDEAVEQPLAVLAAAVGRPARALDDRPLVARLGGRLDHDHVVVEDDPGRQRVAGGGHVTGVWPVAVKGACGENGGARSKSRSPRIQFKQER